MTLELYHHGSSACAAKVRFALAEKRLTWSSRYVDILKGEQFAPEFLALNPKAVVPVLVHDGAVIVESTVICEYLEEAFPATSIYPSSPWSARTCASGRKAVDEKLHPVAQRSRMSSRIATRSCATAPEASRASSPAAPTKGHPPRDTLKWQWIQHGLEALGAADKMRLYDAFLHKMERALEDFDRPGRRPLTMADMQRRLT